MYQVPLEVYEELEGATPERKREIVLSLIEEHPDHRLELPERDGVRADLSYVDLSRQALQEIVAQRADATVPWWHADFKGVNLWRANLQGAYLIRANLQGAFLIDTDLQGAELFDADVQGAFLANTNLQGADLGYANLQGVDLWLVNLQGATLAGANLQGAVLGYADLQGAKLQGAQLQGVDLSTCTLAHCYLNGAWLDRTRLRPEQLGGAVGEELDGDYREARRGARLAYLGLKQNFAELGDYAASAWAYQKERKMEKATKAAWRCRKYYGEEKPFPRPVQTLLGKFAVKSYGKLPCWSPLVWWFWLKYTVRWLTDWFTELLCGYGESVWRVLFWMVVNLLGFATYYRHLLGVCLVEASGSSEMAISFWHYLIYSAGAFTTTGFARYRPANVWVRSVTAFQAIIGVTLAGLLGFVAGNRIRRS